MSATAHRSPGPASKPYLVTVEHELPRTTEDRRIAWLEHVLERLLVRRQCVRLLPISEYALRQFRWRLESLYEDCRQVGGDVC